MNEQQTSPALASRRPPVVIAGAHRAGTSMVTSALADLGLFVGARLDPNAESVFFQGLNEWVLEQAGGAWDRPLPVHDLLANTSLRSLVVDYLALSVRSPRSVSYLGTRRWARSRRPEALDEPWGWKDPRSTFTLPLWVDVFPEAKVIHVLRHGVDVAASLHARTQQTLVDLRSRYAGSRRHYRVRPRAGGFVDSVRCTTLEGAFSLWEEYADEARRHLEQTPGRSAVVTYEDLVEDPADALERLAAFAGLDVTPGRLAAVVERIEPGRVLAYRRDDHLQRFAASVADRLEARGYSAE